MEPQQTITVLSNALGQTVEVTYETHENEPWPVTVEDPKGNWAWNACVFAGHVVAEIVKEIMAAEDKMGAIADQAEAERKEREAA